MVNFEKCTYILCLREWKFAESQTAKMSKEVKFFMNQNQIWIKDTYLFCKMTVIYVILNLVNIEVFFDFVILLCQNMEGCLLLPMKSREYEYFKTMLEKKYLYTNLIREKQGLGSYPVYNRATFSIKPWFIHSFFTYSLFQSVIHSWNIYWISPVE